MFVISGIDACIRRKGRERMRIFVPFEFFEMDGMLTPFITVMSYSMTTSNNHEGRVIATANGERTMVLPLESFFHIELSKKLQISAAFRYLSAFRH